MKNRSLVGIITFYFAAAVAPNPGPLPFWKSKTELYRKLREDRFIVVSAKNEDDGPDKKLSLVSAGFIHAPLGFCHNEIMDFGKYAQFLPYIVESSFDKATENIFIHGALLGYHVNMTLHIKPGQDEKKRHIFWESIAGGFIGMKGTIYEEESDSEHTEVSLDASYKGKSLPIPGFILNWGLEFAGHRITAAMRTRIEDDWQSSKNPVKKVAKID